MTRKQKKKPIRNDQKTTKSKAQTLFDQLECFLISNTVHHHGNNTNAAPQGQGHLQFKVTQ